MDRDLVAAVLVVVGAFVCIVVIPGVVVTALSADAQTIDHTPSPGDEINSRAMYMKVQLNIGHHPVMYDCEPADLTRASEYDVLILIYTTGWTVGWECDFPAPPTYESETEPPADTRLQEVRRE